jgi:Flp pilus assembly protein TadG
MTTPTPSRFQRQAPAKRRSRRARDRHGATLVEFAFVAPVFFLILLASIEFSRLNVMRHTAAHAAYEAARTALVPGATADEAIAAANTLLGIVGTRGATVTVDPAVLTDETAEVTVDIDIPFNRNALLVPRFSKNRSLTASSTLRTERVRSVGL